MYQEGSYDLKDTAKDINIQQRFYRQAFGELIEEISRFYRRNELPPDASPKPLKKLYTMKGKEIHGLLEIPRACTQLVVCEGQFNPVDASIVLDADEGVEDFALRLISG